MIMSLQYEDRLKSVLGYQRQHILPEYTREVVLSQLVRAVTVAQGAETHADTPQKPAGRRIPFEISGNYVTQYDLGSYGAFISDGLIGEWQSQVFSPKMFSNLQGAVRTAPHRLQTIDCGSHLIFGPYITLPAGSYKAVFEVSLDAPAYPKGAGVRFDVFCRRAMAMEEVPAEVLAIGEGCVLEFKLEQPADCVEFRIQAYAFPEEFRAAFTFWGIRLLDAAEHHVVSSRYKTDLEFVLACYDQLLGRMADGLGLGNYLLRLRRGDMSRADIVAIISESSEAERFRALAACAE